MPTHRPEPPRPVSPHGMTEDNVFALHTVGVACLWPRERTGWLRTAYVAAWAYVLAYRVLFQFPAAPAWTGWLLSGALIALPVLTGAGLLLSRWLGIAFALGLLLGAVAWRAVDGITVRGAPPGAVDSRAAPDRARHPLGFQDQSVPDPVAGRQPRRGAGRDRALRVAAVACAAPAREALCLRIAGGGGAGRCRKRRAVAAPSSRAPRRWQKLAPAARTGLAAATDASKQSRVPYPVGDARA